MIRMLLGFCLLMMGACQTTRILPFKKGDLSVGGTDFYRQAAAMKWGARDSFIIQLVRQGAIPPFLARSIPVRVVLDNAERRKTQVTFFVSPDYLSVGNDRDWARVSLTARAADSILSLLDCFAPTPKLVDLIYSQARVKLAPVPLLAYRDSTPVMWHHHLMIEGQRQSRKGLIAGIKKDIVYVSPSGDSVKADRVGIYGWHRQDGKPIQPFYQGHIWWYADYSHGLRLISTRVKVNRRLTTISELLQDSVLRRSLF